MKKLLFSACLMLSTILKAQTADSTAFRAFLYNKEYDVCMRINFYEQDLIISWQEVLGPLPGYLYKSDSSYCWIVLDSSVEGDRAELQMVNDTGSDDLTATLTQKNDTTYILRQRSGATIKVPNKNKWQKLPATLTFIKKKEK